MPTSRLAKSRLAKSRVVCSGLALAVAAAMITPLTYGAAPAAPAPELPPGLSPPVQLSRDDEHDREAKLLNMTELRPGANGTNARDPLFANYDESIANKYEHLPDPLVMNDGRKVTSADMWWKERRPEIVRLMDDQLYGKMPDNVPAVKWTVGPVSSGQVGNVMTYTKSITGHVDNSSYPAIDVNIQLSLTVPANAIGPVPVMMVFGGGFGGGGFGGGRGGRGGPGGARGAPGGAPGGGFGPGGPGGGGPGGFAPGGGGGRGAPAAPAVPGASIFDQFNNALGLMTSNAFPEFFTAAPGGPPAGGAPGAQGGPGGGGPGGAGFGGGGGGFGGGGFGGGGFGGGGAPGGPGAAGGGRGGRGGRGGGGFGGFGGGGPGAEEQILTRGWGYATINPGSIQADNGQGLTQGIIGLVNKGQPRKLDDWGALRAWAWGVSRAIDYFETDPTVDAKQIGLEGHSRYGKGTIVSMAYEPRLAIAYVSSSGSGGAHINRRNFGEKMENIAGHEEYHWLAGNAIKYTGTQMVDGKPKVWTVDDMPVDGHELVAMCAPRPVFISGGIEQSDAWQDPKGMFQAGLFASPVYELLGHKGIVGATEFPKPMTMLGDGDVAFREHEQGHTDGPNWPFFLEFAGKYFHLSATPPPGLEPQPNDRGVTWHYTKPPSPVTATQPADGQGAPGGGQGGFPGGGGGFGAPGGGGGFGGGGFGGPAGGGFGGGRGPGGGGGQ